MCWAFFPSSYKANLVTQILQDEDIREWLENKSLLS